MNVLFLSDNYYLYAGLSQTRITPWLISSREDIDYLRQITTDWKFIIAIEQYELRNRAISCIRKKRSQYIVLMNEIEKDNYVKIDDIVYASLSFELLPLKHLIRYYDALRKQSLSRREYEVLKLSHMENWQIAKRLKLSEKTTSTYKVKIQEKMNMKTKNVLAMNRVKSAIIVR
ncbi:helix-turn-helix domain-containing protein [Leclercia pneumoniae]|uniref:helix-turn-helix domain-containing protein n=1 Tax=Leclercia pneumoniae TaxID=2815358 RepID=UPI003BF52D5B